MRVGRTDYRMQRRALLADVRAGMVSPGEVCDAHPDLVRAGKHLGKPAGDDCPICEQPGLRRVTYVFDEAGRASRSAGGRAIPADSLAAVFERYGNLQAYTVEVCIGCCWHHLLESFGLEHRRRARGSSAPGERSVVRLEQ